MNYLITRDRLLELLNAEQRLQDLDAAGVDNWEGYGEGFRPSLEHLPESQEWPRGVSGQIVSGDVLP